MLDDFVYDKNLIMVSIKPEEDKSRFVYCFTVDEILHFVSDEERYYAEHKMKQDAYIELGGTINNVIASHVLMDQFDDEQKNFFYNWEREQKNPENRKNWFYKIHSMEVYVDSSLITCLKQKANSIELDFFENRLISKTMSGIVSAFHDQLCKIYKARPVERCEILRNIKEINVPNNCDEPSHYDPKVLEKSLEPYKPDEKEIKELIERSRQLTNVHSNSRNSQAVIAPVNVQMENYVERITRNQNGQITKIERLQNIFGNEYYFNETIPSLEIFVEFRKVISWIKNEKRHRLSGPAVILYEHGFIRGEKWYQNDISMREGGLPDVVTYFEKSIKKETEKWTNRLVDGDGMISKEYYSNETNSIMKIISKENNALNIVHYFQNEELWYNKTKDSLVVNGFNNKKLEPIIEFKKIESFWEMNEKIDNNLFRKIIYTQKEGLGDIFTIIRNEAQILIQFSKIDKSIKLETYYSNLNHENKEALFSSFYGNIYGVQFYLNDFLENNKIFPAVQYWNQNGSKKEIVFYEKNEPTKIKIFENGIESYTMKMNKSGSSFIIELITENGSGQTTINDRNINTNEPEIMLNPNLNIEEAKNEAEIIKNKLETIFPSFQIAKQRDNKKPIILYELRYCSFLEFIIFNWNDPVVTNNIQSLLAHRNDERIKPNYFLIEEAEIQERI